MSFLTYIQQWFDGLITETEMHAALDRLSIRGGIEAIAGKRGYGLKYCGYDYRNQRWINIEVV